MGVYLPDTNPIGDVTPLPLFNVHWIVMESDVDYSHTLDLLVAAEDGTAAIELAKEVFPTHDPEHWGVDPVRFINGVYLL